MPRGRRRLAVTAVILAGAVAVPVSGAVAVGGPAAEPGGARADTADRELRRPYLRHRARALELVARTIGISRAELVDGLRQGRSIAQIARSHDTDPQAVVDALVAAAARRIDTAVERGRLPAERAAALTERLPERARALVEREPRRGHRDARQRPRGLRVAKRALHVAAETIGISRAELVDGLRQGRSIAQIARSHDTDPQAVVDALVAAATRRIDTAVERGRLPAERAAALTERLPERARALVGREPPGRRARSAG
jgi:ribosomal protein S20